MSDKTTLKFTVFADFHYKEGMYLSPISDIEEIVNFSHENGVDFIERKLSPSLNDKIMEIERNLNRKKNNIEKSIKKYYNNSVQVCPL